MGRKSKRKGAEGERELARELTRLFGVQARRGRQYSGGPESPDVASDIEGTHWECKRCEQGFAAAYAALEQAAGDADWEEVPVVAHRGNKREWLFICRLDDLPELVRKLKGLV